MRPTMPELMMNVARLVAVRSTCSRLQVGCVITDATFRQIHSFGYNGNVAGGPNECDTDVPGSCGCLHAEENALIKLSVAGDLVLFTTASPCPMCAKRIVNQGSIRRVVYDVPFRDVSGLDILRGGGIAVDQL